MFLFLLVISACSSKKEIAKSKSNTPFISKICTYKVYHQDYFDLLHDSNPRIKERNYQFSIQTFPDQIFKACYTQDLSKCLYELYDFRNTQRHLDVPGPCFKYKIEGENEIRVLDNSQVTLQLNDLLDLVKYSKDSIIIEARLVAESLLKRKDYLDSELLKEIKLIHEAQRGDVELGQKLISYSDNEQSISIDLNEEEMDFLAKSDAASMRSFTATLARTIDNETYLTDQLYCSDVFSLRNSERPELQAIIDQFFEGELDIYEIKHLTLRKDQRIYSTTSSMPVKISKGLHIRSKLIEKILQYEIEQINPFEN